MPFSLQAVGISKITILLLILFSIVCSVSSFYHFISCLFNPLFHLFILGCEQLPDNHILVNLVQHCLQHYLLF